MAYTSIYSGEVLKDLLAFMVEGNDTVDNNLVKIETGISYKFTIPTIEVGDIIQDNDATPTTPKGDIDYKERFLEPSDFQVYTRFDPKHFEPLWREFQPSGALVYSELAPKIQSAIGREILKRKDQYVGQALWDSRRASHAAGTWAPSDPLGQTVGTNKHDYFDGFMYYLLDESKADVITAGTTALSTKDEVFAAMTTMFKAIPKAMKGQKNLKFVMDYSVYQLYEDYRILQENKGIETTGITAPMFRGITIVPIRGILEETIVLGQFGTDIYSNFWVGVDFAGDDEVLKIGLYRPDSRLYFFQMRMKFDTNIVKPKEIVVWSKYVKS